LLFLDSIMGMVIDFLVISMSTKFPSTAISSDDQYFCLSSSWRGGQGRYSAASPGWSGDGRMRGGTA
jgi:hypothetical protein